MKKLTIKVVIVLALLLNTSAKLFAQATTTEEWNGNGTQFSAAAAWTTSSGGAGVAPSSAVFCIMNANTNSRIVSVSSTRSHCNGLRFDLTSGTASGFVFVASSTATPSELAPRPGGTTGKGLGLENHDTNTMTFDCPVKFYSFGAGTLSSTDICTNWAEAGDLNYNTDAFFPGLGNPALSGNGGTLYLLTGSSARTITVGSSSTPGYITSGSLTIDGPGTVVLTGTQANDYTGTTTLKNGTTQVGKNDALSTGTLDINGVNGTVTLRNSGASTVVLDNSQVKFTASAFNLGNSAAGPLTFTGTVNTGSSSATVTDSGTNTFSGALTNTGGFTKAGTGLMVLSGNSSAAVCGPISVNAGTLRVDGTFTNSVTVGSSGTIGGGGTVASVGSLTLNGAISPGGAGTSTIASLFSGNQTWAGGASYQCEFTNATGVAGTGWDFVNITGSLTITATSGNKFTIKVVSLLSTGASGSSANFSTDVSGGSKWKIASASGGISGFNASAFAFDTSGFVNSLNGGSFSVSQSGNDLFLEFHCPARVITPPANQNSYTPGTAYFSVTPGGDLPPTYKWKLNGTTLTDTTLAHGTVVTGSTTANMTLSNLQIADTGSSAQVTVGVTNSYGGALSSAATLTVTVPTGDPAIAAQPINATVGSPSNAVFAVVAQGTSLTYQWYKGSPGSGTALHNSDFGGTKYTGCTTPSFTVLNTEHSADTGSYYVTVSGSGPNSPTNSTAAFLAVTNPPTAATVSPTSATVLSGTSQIFNVSFTGDPVTYQWRKNSSLMSDLSGRIAGSSTAALTVQNIQSSDSASYDCVLANYAGSTTSSSGTLALQSSSAASASIIPLPVTVQNRPGVFTLCPNISKTNFNARAARKIYIDDASAQTGQYLAMMLARSTGFQFSLVTNNNAGPIRNGILLTTVNALGTLGTEGYELTVNNDSVIIRAPQQAGVFYGVQTFLQLLPPQIMSLQPVGGINWTAPCIYVQDYPRFSWRGVMLDVSRHFVDKQEIEKIMDGLALHKINTFHWHLTDDHGWRIEIKSYPLLTAPGPTNTGAWRTGIDYNLNPDTSTAYNSYGRYGGFYTQDDIREVVAYATQRHINVVPEIEIPAHCSAALVSYPGWGCGNAASVYNMDNIGYSHTLFSISNCWPTVFTNILTEVCNLFPSPYIHCGGDETTNLVDFDWNSYAPDNALMQQVGVTPAANNTMVVQYQYFLSTNLVSFLSSKGRTMCGWTEMEQYKIVTNAICFEWESLNGNRAASNGQQVVTCPNGINYYEVSNSNTLLYEPYFQVGNAPDYKTIATAYNTDPVPSNLNPPWTTNIIGGQLNLWTEFVPGALNVEYKLFPRICAEAENTWTPAAQKNLSDFTNRLVLCEQRLAQMGMNYNQETNTQIGTWGPSVPTSPTTFTYPITQYVTKPGEIDVSFAYTSGNDALNVYWVALLENGTEISRSTFTSFIGAGLFKQVPFTISGVAVGGIGAYPLHLQVYHPGATYTLQVSMAEHGSNNSSNGKIYLPNWN